MIDYELISKCIDNEITSEDIIKFKNEISKDIKFAKEYREIRKISAIIQNNMQARKREYLFDMTDEVLDKIKKKTNSFQIKHHSLLGNLQNLLLPAFEHLEELLLKVLPFLK